MRLLLCEEFESSSLNENLWNIREGNRWANDEQQAYTANNLKLHNNKLIITGRHELKNEREFTSSRIDTRDKFSFKYGLIEVVAKLPKAVGSWPAIWLMPQNIENVRWPNCGEIDIVEHCGHRLNKAFFSIHTKDYNHVKNTAFTKTVEIDELTDDFHKFSFFWEEDRLIWFVDDKIMYQVQRDEIKDVENWPFNQEYYIIINMAIGGNFCEGKINKEDFPCDFEIKSVKVFGA